jgi:hypothetical protein
MTVNSRALRLGRRFTGAQVLSHKVHCDPLDGVDFGGERRIKKSHALQWRHGFQLPLECSWDLTVLSCPSVPAM